MKRNQDSRFLKVICSRCGNNQIVFGKSSTKVKCLKCNRLLVRTGGGKVVVRTFVRRIL